MVDEGRIIQHAVVNIHYDLALFTLHRRTDLGVEQDQLIPRDKRDQPMPDSADEPVIFAEIIARAAITAHGLRIVGKSKRDNKANHHHDNDSHAGKERFSAGKHACHCSKLPFMALSSFRAINRING